MIEIFNSFASIVLDARSSLLIILTNEIITELKDEDDKCGH